MKNLEIVLRQFQTKRRRTESLSSKALKSAEERANQAEKSLRDEIAKVKKEAEDSVRNQVEALKQRAKDAERQVTILRKSLTSAMKKVRISLSRSN